MLMKQLMTDENINKKIAHIQLMISQEGYEIRNQPVKQKQKLKSHHPKAGRLSVAWFAMDTLLFTWNRVKIKRGF